MAKRKVKFDFTPSEYQQKIFDWIEHGVGNAVIEAYAGTGKTKTVVASMKLIPKDQKCLFIAFNRAIAEELNDRIKNLPNASARTMHSLGYLMIRRNLGNDIEINEYKYRNYIKSNIADLTTTDGELKTKKQISEYIDSITTLVNFSRFNLAQTEKEINDIATKYDIPVSYDECTVAKKCLDWGKEHYETIDYTDMVWLPVELSLKPIGLQFDWVMLDECQDTSLMAIQMFLKCIKRGGRFIAIGDRNQCQPIGTKVLTSEGVYKNIEDLSIDEAIVTYNDKSSCKFKGYKRENNKEIYASRIKNIEHHPHNGKIITITTDNNLTSSYTQDHLCYAKFNREKCKGKHILYLMCNKKKMYRIGITKLFNDGKTVTSFGLGARMRTENCNKGWILKVYDDEKEARLAEIEYSTIYKIPQTVFSMEKAGCRYLSDEDVINLYSKLAQSYDMEKCAKELLEHFDRRIEYPIHMIDAYNQPKIGGNKYRNGRDYLCNYYACNLLPEVMDVACYDENNSRIRTHGENGRKEKQHIPTHHNIAKIEVKQQEIEVYSLDVEKEHNYVADGILTHNCIYLFAGASREAFDFMVNYPNTTTFKLPITYRCGKRIVDLANTFVKDMIPKEDAEEGEILNDVHIREFKDDDMVLSRAKAPLIMLYNKLIKKGVRCYMKGNDIAKKLIDDLESFDYEELNEDLKKDGLFVRLFDKLFSDRNKLMKKRGVDYDDATLSMQIMDKYDNINTLLLLSEKCRTKTQLIDKIRNIFKEESLGICLSTIHKAKGLEADNVYILCRSSMPSKLAKHDWEKEQERNLIYVAYTRPRKKLGFVSEKEIKPFGVLNNPMEIINELALTEYQVCKVLGKEPMERLENVDLARFKLQNLTKIEEIKKEIPIEIKNIVKKDDLIEELESLLE